MPLCYHGAVAVGCAKSGSEAVKEGAVGVLLDGAGAGDGFLGRNAVEDQLRGVRRTGAPSAA